MPPTLELPSFERNARIQFDECRLVKEILTEIGPSCVMVDVGAHVGTSLVPFADAGWTIFAFEPDPTNRENLCKRINARPSRFERVTVYPEAVSDEAREDVAFFTSPISTGISGLHAFHDSLSETGRVNTVTLNQLVECHALERIDFLKIDVEGHEMSVLRGLDFEKLKPRAILAEFEDGKTFPVYTTNDLATFFEDRGYKVFVSEWHPVERYGIQHSWRCLRERPYTPPKESWGNLIALRDPPTKADIERAARLTIQAPSPYPIRILKAAIHRLRSLTKV
jgi:FkbM family methyltransferase